MSKDVIFDSFRPYTISEEDYSALENSLHVLAMLEEMSSELNPAVGAIPANQVSAFAGLIAQKLDSVLSSAREAYSASKRSQ